MFRLGNCRDLKGRARAHDIDVVPRGEILMNWCHREPSLEDILSDSIIRVVMEADGVDPQKLEAMLRQMAIGLRAARRAEQD